MDETDVAMGASSTPTDAGPAIVAHGQSGGEAQVEGFALVERDYVREKFWPPFDWCAFSSPSPRHQLRKPLSSARLGVVTTAGARLHDQPRFDSASDEGDPSYRVIPSSADASELRFNHGGYDVRRAYADPDTVFPLRLSRQFVAEGKVGSLGGRAYSIMGYLTQYQTLLQETGPTIARGLAEDGVDLALLVPA
jgi:hypothetical protein